MTYTTNNSATEQLTRLGQQIEHESFATVDREAGEHTYTTEQWPVVRRMIHATADFEFNGLTKFHPRAIEAGVQAILNGGALIADVEMICVGVSKPRLAHFGVQLHQFISDDDVIRDAKAADSTRAVFAMRKAHGLGLLDNAIVGIGNAPTALLELIRLINEENAKPALIIGMPVGFVSAAESKALMAESNSVPWIITEGRKGGSTLVVAAIHALLALAESTQKKS
ncbi:MAG: precorrin-8X methylmutase [Pseudomonadales bacterium]